MATSRREHRFIWTSMLVAIVSACGGESNHRSATSLPAIDASARSCELLLEDDTAQVDTAVFDETVRGEVIRQAPRTAVTFFGLRDAPIHRSAVRIDLVGGGAMRIVHAQCFDRTGHPLPNGGLAPRG